MLSKLIKYDFRAIGKVGKPMLLILCGVIVLGMLNAWATGVLVMEVTSQVEVEPVTTLLLMTSVVMDVLILFAIAASGVTILIMAVVHFYKSLLTDEGYLTFTLPVKPSELLLSKLISGSVWQLIYFAVILLGFLLIFTFGIGMSVMLPAWQAGQLSELIQGMQSGFAFVELALDEMFDPYSIVVLVYQYLVMMIYTQLLYYASVFFGAVISKKNRVLASVLCIAGGYMINSIVTSAVNIFVEIFGLIALDTMSTYMGVTFSLNAIFFTAMSVGLFFLTRYMMDKKLNLP